MHPYGRNSKYSQEKMRRMSKFSAAAAGTVHRSSRDGILPTSRDIWRPHTRRFLKESKVSSFIIIPFKSARPVHIELMYFLLLATKKALREKIVASQRIETRNPLADLLSLGEAEAAGLRGRGQQTRCRWCRRPTRAPRSQGQRRGLKELGTVAAEREK